MQLHAARLCLDCQEVHSASQCPNCASESFAALSRWIPVQERRARSRTTEGLETAETYRRLLESNEAKPASRWPRRVALVLAVGVGGWLWRRPHSSQK